MTKSEDKEAICRKRCVIKRKLKFENYGKYLEATQLDNKVNYQEKHVINVDSLKTDHKEFIKNNELILKTQQRFNSERHNVFIEEINLFNVAVKS